MSERTKTTETIIAVQKALTLKSEVAKAIATIENSRRTHMEWLEFYDRDMDDCQTCINNMEYWSKTAGDRDHQLKCIEDYDQVLSVLRSLGN